MLAFEGADLAVGRRELHPGHLLPSVVGRHISNPVVGVDVPPVDAAVGPEIEAAAAGLEQHRGVGWRVFFVGAVAGEDAELVAVVLGRPVAVLAGLACRTQLVDRGRDRTLVQVESRRNHLPGAVELGVHERAESLAHVAVDAGDPGMGEVQWETGIFMVEFLCHQTGADRQGGKQDQPDRAHRMDRRTMP